MTLVVVSLSLFVQTQLRVASDVQGDVCPGRASETAMSDTNVSRVSDSVQQCPILQHANVLIFHMSANLSRKLRDSWSYDMKQTQYVFFGISFRQVSKWCSHQVPCARLPQPFPHPGNTATGCTGCTVQALPSPRRQHGLLVHKLDKGHISLRITSGYSQVETS